MKNKLTPILLIALFLAACTPKAGPTPAGTLPPISETPTTASGGQALSGEAEIKIEGFAFNPATITIQTGTTVKWVNNDSSTHTVVAEDGSFKSSRLGKGDSFTFTFNQAGTFAYRCGVHASMEGTIVVVAP